MIVIGLMSGTSADGIDAAVVRLEGSPPHLRWEVLAHIQQAHSPMLRSRIFAAFRPETSSSELICQLNFELGEAFARAAMAAASAAGLSPSQIDLIGSHGQTIWHEPAGPRMSTLQIGEPAVIAERTGIPVISNFRTRDMAAGGQGAPLVSYVDALLLRHPTRTRTTQNIGGIANLTFLPPWPNSDSAENNFHKGVFGFDTGPGNMLMDYAAFQASAGELTFDRDGKLAALGTVHQPLLAELLADPYLHMPPPKTTGRERFGTQRGAAIWQTATERGISPQNILATLTAFTADSIIKAYQDFLPTFPDEIILSGGGARNPALRQMITEAANRIQPCRVIVSSEIGLAEEAKEAAAFAVLAYETWHNRPGNLPAATGAQKPVILGNLTPGHTAVTFTSNNPLRQNQPGSQGIPLTEMRNPATSDIDTLSTLEMVHRINREDRGVAQAVANELPAIAAAIDAIALRMRNGGRLIYIGAGTSGRLGVLDASECPPTFNTPPGLVIGLIAGGINALTNSIEGAEDDRQAAWADLGALNLCAADSLVGIAASGGTPYVQSGLEKARQVGALTISLACAQPAPIEIHADIAIHPLVGPEVITGSTRLKAGTAQKMVLNMISSGVMIRLGKTFGNLMVDVQMTNTKLRSRAVRIVAEALDLNLNEAAQALLDSDYEIKTAIVANLAGVSAAEARSRLTKNSGNIRLAIKDPGD